MKIGLVGGSYQQSSLPFDAQRSINCYPILDQLGKEVAAMYGTPGLNLFGNLGNSAIRAMLFSSTGRAFVVCGSILYEVNALGIGTARGNLRQSSGIVYLEENGGQLAICDGTNFYIFTYITNVFKQIIGGLEYTTNGKFTVGTGWTLGSGWTISGGVANAATASSTISQNAAVTAPIVAGVSYTITYQIARSAGTLQASIGGTAGIVRSAAGIYTETIIAGATQAITFTGVGFTGTLTNISINDPAFGLPASVGSVSFLDSFFIVGSNGTGQFFKSASNDGTMWNALDFETAESSPDNLLRPIAAIGQLWLMGVNTGEIWTDSGASSFPFQKISGGKMTMGIYSPNTARELDNTLFWVGANQNGFAGVYRANGFIPKKISTEPIDLLLKAATDPLNIRAWSYQEGGHLFYVLTGGGLATSPTYDVTTDEWHERAYTNIQGAFEQHLGCCYMYAFGKHIVGDRTNGNLYIMDNNFYDDNGEQLCLRRVYTHIGNEMQRQRYNALVIGVESGVGNQSGLGFDPQIGCRISNDGARTYMDLGFTPIGKVGAYKDKAEFRRLGMAEQLTIEITITDPIKRAITGSYLR